MGYGFPSIVARRSPCVSGSSAKGASFLQPIRRSLRLRIGRSRVLRELHPARPEEAALVSPRPEQGVQNGDRPRSVRVVRPVPARVTSRVNDHRRSRRRHAPRRVADRLCVDASLRRRPFRRVRKDRLRQLLEPRSVLLDVLPLIAPFIDDHVNPRQQERRVGPGPDGHPRPRLRGRRREARVHHDEVCLPIHHLGEVLNLRVVHVLAEVRPDEHHAVRIGHVEHFGRSRVGTERQIERHVPRPAALRERRSADVGRPERLEQVLEPRGSGPVIEHRDRLRPVLLLQLVELLRDEPERLVPRHRLEFFGSLRPHAEQRLHEPIRIVRHPDPAHAARAQLAIRQRVRRIPLDLDQPVPLRVPLNTALPEAHFAHRPHHASVGPGILSGGEGLIRRERPEPERERPRERPGAEPEKTAPGERGPEFHTPHIATPVPSFRPRNAQ